MRNEESSYLSKALLNESARSSRLASEGVNADATYRAPLTQAESSFGPLKNEPDQRSTLLVAETNTTSDGETPIQTGYLVGDNHVPLVIRPSKPDIPLARLAEWLSRNRHLIEEWLLKHGALLFRGFPISSVADFKVVASAASEDLLDYAERSSPRTELIDKVYTSTDYPASHAIFPHNEHSYSATYPLKIFFCCLVPAEAGGETPLIPIRNVTARISEEVRAKFSRTGWMYVRNFGDGLGLSWKTAFRTSERASVEEYCKAAQISFEWKDGDRLRTRQVRPAFIDHPKTGERLWFNHATFFHVSTLDADMRDVLTKWFSDSELPNNTYYGDGSSIAPDIMHQLRKAYLDEMVTFPWFAGDVIMVDNVLTAHARAAYAGQRKVLVAMAERITRSDLGGQ